MKCLFWSLIMAAIASASGGCASGGDDFAFSVGEREIIATKAQRDELGLKHYVDGNLGVLADGDRIVMYGANGRLPVRVTGTMAELLRKIESVEIASGDDRFRYLSGGPVYRDPESGRLLMFYHAEIHRETARNFYSVLGMAVQTDDAGLKFRDLGPVFMANLPEPEAERAVEICGAPFVVKDGWFYVYARDPRRGGDSRKSHLAVARAKIDDVVRNALAGRNTEWRKYYDGDFTEPALGGKSTPLEEGSPNVRWMDVCYNTALDCFLMVVAANTGPERVELFLTSSPDGIRWSPRRKIADEDGESFYPSFIDPTAGPRRTGRAFHILYTYSTPGGWGRWRTAILARRRVSLDAQ